MKRKHWKKGALVALALLGALAGKPLVSDSDKGAPEQTPVQAPVPAPVQSPAKETAQAPAKDTAQAPAKATVETAANEEAVQAAAKTPEQAPAKAIAEDGAYYSKNEVALYIHTYGHLPKNFITKKQAQALGWSGGPLEPYAPGKSIGGDHFGNYEHRLPKANYHECDIDTKGRSRGAKRIIYSSTRRIYYTADHYQTFEQLY